MSKHLQQTLGITLLITSFGVYNSAVVAQIPSSRLNVEQVVNHLVGQMDTSAQASVNPEAPSVRMTTCKIQLQDGESDNTSVYLYQEQALTRNLEQPYRQRFLEIASLEKERKIESIAYKLVNPSRWIGFCDRPLTQRTVSLNDFGEAICTVSLRPLITIYIGETPPEGCPTNVRGAVKLTNTVILHSQGMDTWDRGFDAEGNQVWGADEDGYQFRWIPSGVEEQE